LGIEQKILEKKGAWIAFQGNLVGQGREAAKQYMAEHPDVAEAVGKAIMEKVQVSGGTVLGSGGGNGETVE
jgi:recombination protein RecA